MKIYNIAKKKKDNNDSIYESLLSFIDSTENDWNYITPEKLNKEDTSKYYLLDIRDSKSFKEGHIKGAKNIFWMDLLKKENLKKLPNNKKIILICYVGHTASQMLVALKLLGYDVSVLKFGMGQSPVEGIPVAGWTDFGFKTIRGK